MKKKLNDCQDVRTQSYQNLEKYLEGYLVWYQPPNGSSWLGPAAVLCHRGPSVWLYTVGDIMKVASCKVKLYELINHSLINCRCDNTTSRVMMEDCLEDVQNILDQERLKQIEDMKPADMKSDTIGTHY